MDLTQEDIKFIEDNNLVNSLDEGEFKAYVFYKGLYNIEFFSDYFLADWKYLENEDRYIKTAYFHREIWQKLSRGENTNIIIARGHGKTTCILIRCLWALCYKIEKEIMYIASGSLGEEGIGKISTELTENIYIKEFFGLLSPISTDKKKKGKWRQKILELTNGSKIYTLSKGQAIRGKRPGKIILDDPQENKDVENKTIVDKFNEWFFTSLYNTLLPGSSICTLGTIIGNMCLVKHLRDEKKWDTIEYKAIENGKSIWDDMWGIKNLEDRKKKIGTGYFNQEYMNIPLTKENTLIKDEWIKYYDPNITKSIRFEKVVMAIDPATSEKEKADETGVCVIGVKENKKYIIYSDGFRLSPSKLESKIIELNDRFQPSIIYQESNIEVKLLEDLKKAGLPISGVSAQKDKYTRLLEVAGQFEFGDVLFNREEHGEVIYQLTNFPDVKHDDRMDAIVWALKGIIKNEQNFIYFV